MSSLLFVLFALACVAVIAAAMIRKTPAAPDDVHRLDIFSQGERAGASLGSAQALINDAIPTELELQEWAAQNTPGDLPTTDQEVWRRGFHRGFESTFKATTKKAF